VMSTRPPARGGPSVRLTTPRPPLPETSKPQSRPRLRCSGGYGEAHLGSLEGVRLGSSRPTANLLTYFEKLV
jgi:hypothetical protein